MKKCNCKSCPIMYDALLFAYRRLVPNDTLPMGSDLALIDIIKNALAKAEGKL